MHDLPPQNTNSSFIQQIVATREATPLTQAVREAADLNAALLKKAQDFKNIFADGFQWSDLGALVGQIYDFTTSYQNLSREQIQSCVLITLNHLIDVTDTPYLPDNFTDPILKTVLPPFISLLGNLMEGKFALLPTSSSPKPSGDRLMDFMKKTQAIYADGFQASDIAATIKVGVEFAGSFPLMSKADKQKCVIDLVNFVIDKTDTPSAPDFVTDPIFKSMAAGFIKEIFKRLP